MQLNKQHSVKLVSIVVSVYNEEALLTAFIKVLSSELKQLGIPYEVLLVNDGSTDGTFDLINTYVEAEQGMKAIHFSRNFGHEAAMLAGIDNASGDVVICMDADLQHPPALIPKMVDEYTQGVEIVNMVCTNRADAGWLKRITSRLFYKMINRISPVQFAENASDFFLISGRVAAILKENFRERARFLRGFIQIIGFKKSTLSFDAVSRQGGKSKYSLYRLFVLSMGAIVSFSKLPLHLGIVVGAIFSVFSLLVGGYSIYMKFVGETPPGYTTLVVFMSMSFAIMFFLIGIIGVYIGYNFDENKKRPHYLIATKHGFEQY